MPTRQRLTTAIAPTPMPHHTHGHNPDRDGFPKGAMPIATSFAYRRHSPVTVTCGPCWRSSAGGLRGLLHGIH